MSEESVFWGEDFCYADPKVQEALMTIIADNIINEKLAEDMRLHDRAFLRAGVSAGRLNVQDVYNILKEEE